MSDGTQVHYRTCPLCEATCGLEITMRGDEVVRIRGDRDDVFSKGFLCPKGSTLKQLHEDPDRLRRPVIRRGDDPATATWEEVSWDEAFAEIERRLVPLLETHGRNTVALYLGNPNVHNLAGTLYVRPLIMALGTRNIFSASTVDQMPRHVSSGLLYGSPDAIPVPDLDRTDHLLILGANPYESNGSVATAPDFPGRLEAIIERGGQVVVVDPRRTKTAEKASRHVRIRPGTDAHLLLAMLHVLVAEDLVDPGEAGPHLDGIDAIRELVAPFSPAAVAPLTGIDATTITELARGLAAAPTAAVYTRIGVHTAPFGTLVSWAGDVLTALTGNLDRPGGLQWPLPAHTVQGTGTGRGFSTGRHHSRVEGHPEVRSEFPVATLAAEIETPGPDQVRAFITVAGNPALSTPNSARLQAALATLDCMVCVDPYLNETTRFAHVILPPPSPLARSHYDLAFNSLAVRNVANYSPPIVETDGLAESDILARLALVASGQGATADPTIIDGMLLDAILQRAVKPGAVAEGRTTEELAAMLEATAPTDRVLEAMLRAGHYGDGFGARPGGVNFATLLANPHGIDFGPLEPRLPEVLRTPNGRIDLAPPSIAADVDRLRAVLDTGPPAADGELVLIGRRHLRSNNSWMHNVKVLVKGKARCTLQVHPEDAARLGLVDGGTAKVASRVGAVLAPVEVTDELMPGVVSLPHGWGHDLPGVRMDVARDHAGVNSNLLTDEAVLDPLSGNASLNAIPVTVAPA